MKRIFPKAFCMMLIMLFAGATSAQQLVGESDPFVFNTLQPVIPLSDYAFLIFFILATGFIFYRYYLQKRRAAF